MRHTVPFFLHSYLFLYNFQQSKSNIFKLGKHSINMHNFQYTKSGLFHFFLMKKAKLLTGNIRSTTVSTIINTFINICFIVTETIVNQCDIITTWNWERGE